METGFVGIFLKRYPETIVIPITQTAWKAKSLSAPVFFYPISVKMAHF